MARIHAKRIDQLVELLTEVSKREFNMWSFGDFSLLSAPAKQIAAAQKPDRTVTLKPECGFAGCAIGWAGAAGLFPELVRVKNFGTKRRPQLLLQMRTKAGNWGGMAFEPLEKFFGLTDIQVTKCFAPYETKTRNNYSPEGAVRQLKLVRKHALAYRSRA